MKFKRLKHLEEIKLIKERKLETIKRMAKTLLNNGYSVDEVRDLIDIAYVFEFNEGLIKIEEAQDTF